MNLDFSLIDSSLIRASEGLRVLDEVARYILKNEELFTVLKTVRHELQTISVAFGPATLVASRSGDADLGVGLAAKEADRSSTWSIIKANSLRIQESFRVLEEFSKIYAPRVTEKIKHARYTVYQEERKLLEATPHYWLNTYFEVGIIYPLADTPEEVLWLATHGAKVVQFRDKSNDKKSIYEKTKYLTDYWPSREVLLILNDHPDIAAELPVAGVHIGQDVTDMPAVRRIVGSNKIIGRSNNAIEKFQQSIKDGADYVSIGPVFATPTKPDRAAVGLETVTAVSKIATIPWLAIGGIDATTIDGVRQAGAKNVAVVRSARDFFSN